jgi:hypothetical protein
MRRRVRPLMGGVGVGTAGDGRRQPVLREMVNGSLDAQAYEDPIAALHGSAPITVTVRE